MSAISRVLLEDGKRSMDLVTCILNIFYIFSGNSRFHPIITQNKIGNATLKIIDRELDRWRLWKAEIQNLKDGNGKSDKDKDKDKEKSLDASSKTKAPKDDMDEKLKKMKIMLKKQDQLWTLILHLLLNLAEDISLEVKMIKANILDSLLAILEIQLTRRSLFDFKVQRKKSAIGDRSASAFPPSSDVLTSVLRFLHKLSIFKENKDTLSNLASTVVLRLSQLIPYEDPAIMTLSIRILLNLANDETFRNIIAHQQGLLPRIVALLHEGSQKQTNPFTVSAIIRLLYVLSVDDKVKSVLAYTDVVPVVSFANLNDKLYAPSYS
jgi:hypothetical protein